MNIKLTIALVLIVLSVGIYFGTRERAPHVPQETSSTETAATTSSATYESASSLLTSTTSSVVTPTKTMKNRIATFTTTKGIIKIELFEDTMPITTGNFIKLAESKYYDGVKFHRVIADFMIQSGDPLTKDDAQQSYWGTGGPGYAIPDEHVAGSLLTNVRGTISMANSGPNSGGSQFFINVGDNTFLDFDKEPLGSKHPVFGHVIAGMDIVDTIVTSPRNNRDVPLEPIVITSLTIGAN